MSIKILNHASRILGLVALTAIFATSMVNAAPVKKAVIKKSHALKSTSAHKTSVVRKTARFTTKIRHKQELQAIVPAKLSYGQLAGLHGATDSLELKSSVALVIDQDTREVLFSKNDHAVLPIASITKLMTGVIISGAHLPLDELITVTEDDVDTEKHSRSRLKVGTTLTRGEMLHLALMSSENRAAHALGHGSTG